jgi:cobalt-zinc-cadmium efflux system membrane fusion protein
MHPLLMSIGVVTVSSARALRASFIPIALLLALSACDEAARESSSAGSPAASAVDDAARRRTVVQLNPDEIRRSGLKVERIDWSERQETTAVFGTVEANRDRFARVTPPIAGRVAQIRADLGHQVVAGEALATLESPELAEIRSLHYQAQTELNLVRSSYDRAQRLVADGAIAQKDLLRARSEFEKAQAALHVTASKLTALRVDAAAADGTSPASLSVVAPFGGTIIEKNAVLGEYAQAYRPLFSIADLSSVWIEVNLYDRDLDDVATGTTATVNVNAYPERRFDGIVTYISSLLDKETRTVKARVEVANTDGSLKPGMFANVLIGKRANGQILRLPETALVLVHGQMTAFVSDLDGNGFEPRPVEIGERAGGHVTVTAGLEVGYQIVTSGAYALKARLLTAQLGNGL